MLDPPVDGVVQLGGAHVLGDGQDVDAVVHEVRDGSLDLRPGLTHAEDEVGLGQQARLGGPAEHGQALWRRNGSCVF